MAHTKLKCDMVPGCENPGSHIDVKGFVYCETHGLLRQRYMRCRKLKPKELKQLKSGKPLSSYENIPQGLIDAVIINDNLRKL